MRGQRLGANLFEDGHARQLPVLTEAPLRYATKTFGYLDGERRETRAAG